MPEIILRSSFNEMSNSVICRSDSAYAERPLAFFWQGRRIEIVSILARWRTPEGRRFLVKTQEFGLFNLCYDEHNKTWQVNQE